MAPSQCPVPRGSVGEQRPGPRAGVGTGPSGRQPGCRARLGKDRAVPGSSPGRGPGQQQQRCLQAPTRMSHTCPASKPELASQRKTEWGVRGSGAATAKRPSSYCPALPASITHQPDLVQAGLGPAGPSCLWPRSTRRLTQEPCSRAAPREPPSPPGPHVTPCSFPENGDPAYSQGWVCPRQGALAQPRRLGSPRSHRVSRTLAAPGPITALQGRSSKHTLRRLLIPEHLALGHLTFTWSRGQAPSGESSCPPS